MKKLVAICSILSLTFSLAYSHQPKNLFINSDFESEDLSSWTPQQCQMSLVKSPVHNGNSSLKITGRTRNEHGVTQHISDKVTPGYRYTISGAARLEQNGWDHFGIYLLLDQDKHHNQILIGQNDVNNTSWASFNYSFLVPDSAQKYNVSVQFRTLFSTTDYYLDDLVLRSTIQIRSSAAKDGEKISVNVGPLTNDQKELKANLEIQDVNGKIIYQGSPRLEENVELNLPTGFYNAIANATDSDSQPFKIEKNLLCRET